MKEKYYIGLSVTYHDSAIALLDGQGDVLFAEASERYLQYKRALNCEPDNLFRIADLIKAYCAEDADFVVAFNWRKKRPYYEKISPLLGYFSAPGLRRRGYQTLTTFLEKYKLFHMLACQVNSMEKGGINFVRKLNEEFSRCGVSFRDFDHHLTHAAMACYSGPFAEAACMVVDSYGERGSMAFYQYKEGKLHLCQESKGIESLGFYYMKLTELCGFDWLRGEEWKVMGLAPYGKLDQEVYDRLESMVSVEGLTLRQNLKNIRAGLKALEKKRRHPQQSVWDAADLAYTGQYFFAETMAQLLNNFHRLGFSDNLVLGGGCALNSSFNGEILQKTPFEHLHVPSAPADDGTALGAALLAFYQDHPEAVPRNNLLTPYLGSLLAQKSLENLFTFSRIPGIRHLPDSICQETAKLLAQGKLVGWLQGRAEFGPRALGNRSILADPRQPSMKEKINARVKFREAYRPFAPSILHEFGEEYFYHYQESPYMERALRFRETVLNQVPAVVHADQTGRLQTVKREWNRRFYDLIEAFYRLTGVPVLLNTSFNIMGKPIAHSVEDALGVFFTTGLDALVLGDYLILKPNVELPG